MFGPFLFLFFSNKLFETDYVVQSEVFISLISFIIIIIDYSSTLLLSKYANVIFNSGRFTTVIIFKFSLAFLLLTILLIYFLLTNSLELLFISSIILVLIATIFDINWYYINKNELWVPQLQVFSRYLIAIILILCNLLPIISISISYVVVSFFVVSLNHKKININYFRFKFFKYLSIKYFYPTLSESTTSMFSKMDVFYANTMLHSKDMYSYIIIRKVLYALNSVVFSSVRSLFVLTNQKLIDKFKKIQLLIVILSFFIGVPILIILSDFLFELELSQDNIYSFILFSLILFIGYLKNVIQLEKLFSFGLFKYEFIITLVSLIAFLTIPLFIKINTLYLFILVRLSPDILYIIIYYLTFNWRSFKIHLK